MLAWPHRYCYISLVFSIKCRSLSSNSHQTPGDPIIANWCQLLFLPMYSSRSGWFLKLYAPPYDNSFISQSLTLGHLHSSPYIVPHSLQCSFVANGDSFFPFIWQAKHDSPLSATLHFLHTISPPLYFITIFIYLDELYFMPAPDVEHFPTI